MAGVNGFNSLEQVQKKMQQTQQNLQQVNVNLQKNSEATTKNTSDLALANEQVNAAQTNLQQLGQNKSAISSEINTLKQSLSQVSDDDEDTKKAYQEKISEKELDLKSLDEETKSFEIVKQRTVKLTQELTDKNVELQAEYQNYFKDKTYFEQEIRLLQEQVESFTRAFSSSMFGSTNNASGDKTEKKATEATE